MSSATTVEINSPYTVANDAMEFASPVLDFIQSVSAANTAYDAAQAKELRDWQAYQNRIAMDFNAEEAAKNRAWQEMMSNTAHQREVKDMVSAGINPILSVTGGNGAAVTSGATASGVTSSGAMSQSDKSAAGTMVNLFGSFISALMQQQSSLVSAVTNMAVTDKNNQTAANIAAVNNATSKEVAQIYTDATRYVADIGRLNTMTSAEASKFCSELSAWATKAAASIHANASMYGSDKAWLGTKYASDVAASASRYATDQNNDNKEALQEDAQDFETWMKQNYPNNPWNAAAAMGKSIGWWLATGSPYGYNPFSDPKWSNKP